MIQGTFGRTYIESFAKLNDSDSPLLYSWENRLRERMAIIGSTESALIWRVKDIAPGLSISRLVPSTLHINGAGNIGSHWPTPKASGAGETSRGGDRKNEALIGGLMRGADPSSQSANISALAMIQMLASVGLPPVPIETNRQPDSNGQTMTGGLWSTPRESDGRKGGPMQEFSGGSTPLPAQIYSAHWRTPLQSDGKWRGTPNVSAAREAAGRSIAVQDQMVMTAAHWITPSARDGKDSEGMALERPDGRARIDQLPRQLVATWPTVTVSQHGSPETPEAKKARGAHTGTTMMDAIIGAMPNGSSVTTEKRGAPNPEFAFWLMGFPDVWIYGALRAMQSIPKRRRKSSKR